MSNWQAIQLYDTEKEKVAKMLRKTVRVITVECSSCVVTSSILSQYNVSELMQTPRNLLMGMKVMQQKTRMTGKTSFYFPETRGLNTINTWRTVIQKRSRVRRNEV